MVRNVQQKASWEQHLAVAQLLYEKGLKADQTVEWFKQRKYTLKRLHYEATRVSAMIAGMECSHEHIDIDDMVSTVNDGLANGTLKYTKTKLVHTPKKA